MKLPALILATVIAFLTPFAMSATVDDLPEHVLRGGMPNIFSKLVKGGEVAIAYLGGSITAQPGYRDQCRCEESDGRSIRTVFLVHPLLQSTKRKAFDFPISHVS